MGKEEDKAALRKIARKRRSGLDRETVSAAAGLRLVDMVRDRFRGAIIAGYRPIGTEMSPALAMARCHALGCEMCVPVVQESGGDLVFGHWTPGMRMAVGQYGIEEPAAVELRVPEVLVVPLLAYDGAGWRLGYGGGYYDRALAGLRAAGRVAAIGFAASGQEVDTVPHGRHDQPLDWMVTEVGVTEFGSESV